MGIGSSGAKNAGLFAVQILATADERLATAYAEFKAAMAREVEAKDARLQDRIAAGD